MPSLFEKQYNDAMRLPDKITDFNGSKHFIRAFNEVEKVEDAQKEYAKANQYRLMGTEKTHEAAYIYLALAYKVGKFNVPLKASRIKIEEKNGMALESESFTDISAEFLFHFAGHAFREIGQLNRAADAYWRAGALGTFLKDGQNKIELPTTLSVRSYARSKVLYSEIGQIRDSDKSHRLEWEARKRRAGILNKFLLWIWKYSCQYGTSFLTWLVWLVGITVLFTVTYELLHDHGLIYQGQTWYAWLSSFYYTIVTTSTVGYGDFVPIGKIAQMIVVLNIVLGYFILGTGLTIISRKLLGR